MQEGSQCWQFSSSGRRLDVGRVIKIPSNFFGIILRKHHFLQNPFLTKKLSLNPSHTRDCVVHRSYEKMHILAFDYVIL